MQNPLVEYSESEVQWYVDRRIAHYEGGYPYSEAIYFDSEEVSKSLTTRESKMTIKMLKELAKKKLTKRAKAEPMPIAEEPKKAVVRKKPLPDFKKELLKVQEEVKGWLPPAQTINFEIPIPAAPKPTAPLTDKAIKLPAVQQLNPYLGCDPEFFFKLGDTVIGAEKVFMKDGLLNTTASVNDRCVLQGTTSKFIIDGVQAELNPRPNTCRANLANEISACFKTLKKELEKQGKGVTVDLARSVAVDPTELASLDKDNQKLGCMPSKSVYQNAGIKLEEVDGLKHTQRSAGGHIHIGTSNSGQLKEYIGKEPEVLVQLLDLLCGNTCVLVDRDMGNVERRKLYGRAGEYRLPKHGLEYRTLSNFWLEHYYLMSLAFGTARLAVELFNDKINRQTYIKEFLGAVNKEDVQKAINENDYDLALVNFKKIEGHLSDVTGNWNTDHFAIQKDTLPAFHFFISQVKEKGLKHYFKQDPIAHWTSLPECHRDGFHMFLTNVVKPQMEA
jgi:hypothetical protein